MPQGAKPAELELRRRASVGVNEHGRREECVAQEEDAANDDEQMAAVEPASMPDLEPSVEPGVELGEDACMPALAVHSTKGSGNESGRGGSDEAGISNVTGCDSDSALSEDVSQTARSTSRDSVGGGPLNNSEPGDMEELGGELPLLALAPPQLGERGALYGERRYHLLSQAYGHRWLRWRWPRCPCRCRARGIARLEEDRSRKSHGLQQRWDADAAMPAALELGVASLGGESLGSVHVCPRTTGAELRARVSMLAKVPLQEVALVLAGASAPLEDAEAVLGPPEQAARLRGPAPQIQLLRVQRHYALSGSSDGALRLWDVGRGTCLTSLRGHCKRVGDVAADWATRRALSGSMDGTLRLWDLDRAACVETLPDSDRAGINCLSVDWSTRRCLCGLADGLLALWDLDAASCMGKLRRVHQGPVQCVVGDWAGGRALSGSTDGALLLWRLELAAHLELQGHRVWVSGVAVDTGSRYAVSGSIDGMLRLWELGGSTCIRTLKGQWNDVKCLAVDWAAGQVLSGAAGGALKLWDLGSGRCIEAVQSQGGIRQDVNCIAADWATRRALSGSAGGELALWDLDSGSRLQVLEGESTVKCVTMAER